MCKLKYVAIVFSLLYVARLASGSEDSNGPKGINSIATGLTGAGIPIGQVEAGRPGQFDYDTDKTNSQIDIADVFVRDRAAAVNEGVDDHALWVASVINSKQTGTLSRRRSFGIAKFL